MDAFSRQLLKHRIITALICAVAIAFAAYFVPRFNNNVSGATFAVDHSQTARTEQLLRDRFKNFPSEQDIVVFHSDTLTAQDPAFRELVSQAKQSLEGKPYVTGLVSPYDPGSGQQVSADGHTALMIVNLQGKDSDLQKNTETLSAALPPPTTGVSLHLTGQSPLNADVIEQENKDIEHADTIGLPVAFAVLLLAFGAVVAASLPLLLGALGVMATFGVLGIFSHIVPFDVFVQSAVTMIGLALGIDYCLMMVTRFREELARGSTPLEATRTTLNTAGRAVLFSGFTVLVSLSGLLLVQSPLFRGIAIGTMVTVGVMLALCLVLLPIILSVLGSRINSLRLFRQRPGQDREQRFWERWAHGVMQRPAAIALATVAILVAIAWPVHTLQLGLNLGTETLQDQASAQGLRQIQQHFTPGIISPIQIVVSRDSGPFTTGDLTTVATLHQKLSSDSRIKAVSSLPQSLTMLAGTYDAATLATAAKTIPALGDQVNIGQGTNITIVTAVPAAAPDSQQAAQLLKDIQENILPPVMAGSNLHTGYLGVTAQIADLNTEVRRAIPVVLSFVIGTSFILLAWTFRSLVLPLKAIFMNLLALGAAFGLVVLVFQHGLGEGIFDFNSPGYIQNYLPLLTFVILFGLSMDYEVFLLSRIREEWLKTGDNSRAVAVGLAHTAKVITHAAAIMIVVFSSFLIAHMLEIKQLGFALAAAVFIDATLIRLLLVPATMRLMGRWNWWLPKWLR